MKDVKKYDDLAMELNDDDLDLIDGGYIPKNVWNKMTTTERQTAQKRSLAKWTLEITCEELDADVVCHDYDYVLDR